MRGSLTLALTLSALAAGAVSAPAQDRVADAEADYARDLSEAAGLGSGRVRRVAHDLGLRRTPSGQGFVTAGLEIRLDGLRIQRYDLTRSRVVRWGEDRPSPGELFGHVGAGAGPAAARVSRALFVPEFENMRTPFLYEARGPEILELSGERLSDPALRKRVRAAAWSFRPPQGVTSIVGYYGGPGVWAVDVRVEDGYARERIERVIAAAAEARRSGRPVDVDLTRPGHPVTRAATIRPDDVLESGPARAVVRFRGGAAEAVVTAGGARWHAAPTPDELPEVARALPPTPGALDTGSAQDPEGWRGPAEGIADRLPLSGGR